MIGDAKTPSKPWHPEGFDAFERFYPATQWRADDARNLTDAFVTAWRAEPSDIPESVAVVLTPGLFAEAMPGVFRAARAAFGRRRILVTPARSTLNVAVHGARLDITVRRWLRAGEQFVWLTHSKGGLDALAALRQPALRASCAGLVMVQPPVGASPVLEHWLASRHPAARWLASARTAAGLREVTSARSPTASALARGVAELAVPTLNVVTWSVKPTRWLDSFHGAIGRLRPGHAHDGQFLVQDQRVPGAAVVTLPHVDHAQPVLGGLGFDAGRFWRVCAEIVLAPQTNAISKPGMPPLESGTASGSKPNA